MTWARRLLPALLAAILLAGCSPGTKSSSSTSNGGSSGGILFHVQVDFTGLDTIRGSFVDNTSGTGYSSCADFAKGDSVGSILIGPATPTQTATTIGGKTINFGLHVSKDQFHGPGTYTGVLLAGVKIGEDTFLTQGAGDSTETLNADGSGHAAFTNLSGGSVTGPQGNESGTITWTCSQ